MTSSQLNVWLAALIDGEGSIMLNRRLSSPCHKRQIKPRYRAVVSIANTDYRLMAALIYNTGISRIYRHRVNGDPKTPMKRAQWTWRLASDDIRKWLPKVRPYLILKGEQSDLLLEALRLKKQVTPGNAGFLPVNRPPLLLRLDEIYLTIRKLNQCGRTTEITP